jgi:hypothetical protein
VCGAGSCECGYFFRCTEAVDSLMA